YSSNSIIFLHSTPTSNIYTLSLHDALPISESVPDNGPASRFPPTPGPLAAYSDRAPARRIDGRRVRCRTPQAAPPGRRPATGGRSEEHTSELQSQSNIVCRLLLEKKKQDVS